MNNPKHTFDGERALWKAFASLKTESEVKSFMEDLCTISEITAMAARLTAAKMLMDGQTYEQVIAKTNISSATLSRVSKCVKYGNGYALVLKKKKND